jgi:hypothetical protein
MSHLGSEQAMSEVLASSDALWFMSLRQGSLHCIFSQPRFLRVLLDHMHQSQGDGQQSGEEESRGDD